MGEPSAGGSWLRDSLDALLIALIFALFARTWVVQAFRIPTGSMEDNLLVGDHILVNKFVYGQGMGPGEGPWLPTRRIERGDVVVFKFPEDPERDFIKRCLGLPGDEVELRDKVLHINGQPLDETAYTRFTDPTAYPDSPFVPEHYRERDNFGPSVVPEGHLFCMGDNRDNSHDSRFWGTVPVRYVKGRALLVYWSRDPKEGGGQWGGGETLGGLLAGGTRWDRSFRLVR